MSRVQTFLLERFACRSEVVPMSLMSVRRPSAYMFALSVASLVFGVLPNHLSAAVITYNLDVNGSTAGFGVTTGSTYDWDDTTNGGFWSNNSTSTTGNIA